MRIKSVGVLTSLVLGAWAAQPVVVSAQSGSALVAAGSAASKVELRGKDKDVKVLEIRALRRSDILTVQSDFRNENSRDRIIFYRFRWLDANGNMVGDGEPFKQVRFLGKQMQTFKAVAPTSAVVDFRIELNVERP